MRGGEEEQEPHTFLAVEIRLCPRSNLLQCSETSPSCRQRAWRPGLRGAQTFIRQLSARVAGAVTYRLLDEASWATQGCAPLLRSAITFSARRALAAGIRRSTCSGAEAAYLR